MGDRSLTFEPSDMVSKTLVAQSAASDASSIASDAGSKALVALSKASDASVAAAGVASQASDASVAAQTALSKASEASVAAGGVASKASEASVAALAAFSKASDISSALVARWRTVSLKPHDWSTAISSGIQMFWTVPGELAGLDLKSAGAHVYSSGSGKILVQIHNLTSGVDMLTRRIEIDTGELDSITASSAGVIDGNNDGVAAGEAIRVDLDSEASGALGLEVRLSFG